MSLQTSLPGCDHLRDSIPLGLALVRHLALANGVSPSLSADFHRTLGTFCLIFCLPLFLSVLPLSILGNLYFSGIDYWHKFPNTQLGLYNPTSSVPQAILLQAILHHELLLQMLSLPMRVDFHSSPSHLMTSSSCCAQAL